jgi:hypothetical protein
MVRLTDNADVHHSRVYIQFMDDSGAENLSNEAHWEREYHSSAC